MSVWRSHPTEPSTNPEFDHFLTLYVRLVPCYVVNEISALVRYQWDRTSVDIIVVSGAHRLEKSTNHKYPNICANTTLHVNNISCQQHFSNQHDTTNEHEEWGRTNIPPPRESTKRFAAVASRKTSFIWQYILWTSNSTIGGSKHRASAEYYP